jgi:hypothetical protein
MNNKRTVPFLIWVDYILCAIAIVLEIISTPETRYFLSIGKILNLVVVATFFYPPVTKFIRESLSFNDRKE